MNEINETMRHVILKRLIYEDKRYVLPFEYKVDNGDQLTAAEQLERDSYAFGQFGREYEALQDYLHSKNAVVMAQEDMKANTWRAVYDLHGAILLCWFNQGLPLIGMRAIPAPNSVDEIVREVESLFEGKAMRKDYAGGL